MNHNRRRPTNDAGSAVAFLPILGLLLIAGVAALVGIALQPSDASATPDPPTITAAQLGESCAANLTGSPAAQVQALAACVDQRITTALGAAAASTNSGYGGTVVTETFTGKPVVVIHWNTTPPAVVAFWAARQGGSVQLTGPATTPVP